MNLKFLPLIGLPLLVSCSYNSMEQAGQACNDWANEKGKYTTQVEFDSWKCLETINNPNLGTHGWCIKRGSVKQIGTDTKYIRTCRLEERTDQYLGYDTHAEEGKVYGPKEDKPEKKIVRHFRF